MIDRRYAAVLDLVVSKRQRRVHVPFSVAVVGFLASRHPRYWHYFHEDHFVVFIARRLTPVVFDPALDSRESMPPVFVSVVHRDILTCAAPFQFFVFFEIVPVFWQS